MGDLSNKYVVVAESVGGTWWVMPDGSETNEALLAGVFDEAKARQLVAAHQGFLARPAREVLCGPAGSLGAALRDVERAFLVHEVGLTLEQADDAQVDQRLLGMPRITPGVYVEVDAPARAVTGDIDRNGAASMLPGIIKALEQRGIPPYDEDELLESGVDTAAGHGTDKHRPGLVLTALKLLARARHAEDQAIAPVDAAQWRLLAMTLAAHGITLTDHEQVMNMVAGSIWARRHPEPRGEGAVQDGFYRCRFNGGRWAVLEVHDGRVLWPGLGGSEPVDDPRFEWGGMVQAAPEPTAPSIDPTVAALAVIDDLETNGDLGPSTPIPTRPVDDGTAWAKDQLRIHDGRLSGRAAAVERLAKVIASTRRDVKPENPWPLWCAFETANSEHRFHGPFDTEEEAVAEAAHLTDAMGRPATVRRCRRVRASEALRQLLPDLVERVNESPEDLARVGGALTYGDWERPIASVRGDAEALDGLIEIRLCVVEPEGATS